MGDLKQTYICYGLISILYFLWSCWQIIIYMMSLSRFDTDTSTALIICKQRISHKYFYDNVSLITKTCSLVKLTTAQLIKRFIQKRFLTGNTNTHQIFLWHTSLLAANPAVCQCCLTFAYTLYLNLLFCIFWVEIIGESPKFVFFKDIIIN